MTDDDDNDEEGTPLPRNPELREVVQAKPSDKTAMIDLEAVEAKRAAKRQAQPAEGDAGEADDEKTPAPEGDPELDPEATGTMARRKKKGQTRTGMSRVVRDEQSRTARMRESEQLEQEQQEATEQEEPPQDDDEPKERTRQTEQIRRQKKKKKKQALSPAAAGSLVIIGVVGMLFAIFFAVRATAVLTVTTVPHGAQVSIDGAPVGTSPLQKRVRTGTHVVELSLEGFEPFREVVDVPSAGLPFLQPLKALPPPPPPPPTNAEIAMDLAGQAKRLFEGGDLDAALAKVEEIEKLVGAQHKESEEIRKLIREAVAKRDADRRRDAGIAAREAQLSRSRQLAEEGRRFYEQGKLGPSRTALYEALKLDAKNPDPHRTLAKIFNRENEVEKVRYHLERFLALGGNDADFKVREWLKAHPK